MTETSVVVAARTDAERKALLGQLVSAGYACHECESLDSVRERLAAVRIDVAIIDADIGGDVSDAIGFAEQYTHDVTSPIWIFKSSTISGNDVRRLVRLPVADYLPEPVAAEEILLAVQRATELRLVGATKSILFKSDVDGSFLLGHELNNYLTPLLGMAQLQKTNSSRDPDCDAASMSTEVFESAQILAGFVDRLRIIRSLELHPNMMRFRRGDIIQMIQSIVSMRQSQPDAPRVEISVNADCDDCGVDFDFETLPRVLDELLKNAIEHTISTNTLPEPRVIVSIDTSTRNVDISVRNGGSVLSCDRISRFFMPFNADRRLKSHSSGLGTTYVKLVVEMHGGAVGVKSDEINGTNVWITIPRYQNETATLVTN